MLALEALFTIPVNQNFTMVSKRRDPELDSMKLITQVQSVCWTLLVARDPHVRGCKNIKPLLAHILTTYGAFTKLELG